MPLPELIESALGALSAITDEQPLPRSATGTSTLGKITITLAKDGIVACRVEASLVQSYSTARFRAAAQLALDRARGALAVERPSAAPSADTIFGELMAHLAQLSMQTRQEGADR